MDESPVLRLFLGTRSPNGNKLTIKDLADNFNYRLAGKQFPGLALDVTDKLVLMEHIVRHESLENSIASENDEREYLRPGNA